MAVDVECTKDDVVANRYGQVTQVKVKCPSCEEDLKANLPAKNIKPILVKACLSLAALALGGWILGRVMRKPCCQDTFFAVCPKIEFNLMDPESGP